MVKSEIDDVTTYYPSAAYQVKTNADSTFQSEVRYSAYGEVRHADGTTVTDKLYTGHTCPGGQCQGQQEVEIGLGYYIARFYDPVIAHFIQADSIEPLAGSQLASQAVMAK